MPGCLDSGHQELPNLEAMTSHHHLITPPSPHLKPESDLTCGNTSSNPAAHQTKSTALPGSVHVDFLHRLVGSDPGYFSCQKLNFTFSLNLNLKSVSTIKMTPDCRESHLPLQAGHDAAVQGGQTFVPRHGDQGAQLRSCDCM